MFFGNAGDDTIDGGDGNDFVLFFAAGNPARDVCGKFCTPQKLAQITQVLGYDQPISYQFGQFMKGLVVGRDFPVDDKYREALEKKNPDLVIHWGAYLGLPQQELRAGRLAELADELVTLRADLRHRHGWVMDTYALTQPSDEDRADIEGSAAARAEMAEGTGVIPRGQVKTDLGLA